MLRTTPDTTSHATARTTAQATSTATATATAATATVAGVISALSSRAPWPLPALMTWAAGWALFTVSHRLHAGATLAISLGAALGVALSWLGSTPWRRLLLALGFPLSMAVSGLAGEMPPWGWLLPLGLLALVYPINIWCDAPLFPTPTGGLAGLGQRVVLPAGARVFDGGCGLGAGLHELRREYPAAQLDGVEWSWPLSWACALRCRFARVKCGNLWAADWSNFDLVYLFQRPESMTRAWHMARRHMRPGCWLVSMEFPVPDLTPHQTLHGADGRLVWIYQVPVKIS